MFTENADLLKGHLTHFYNQFQYCKEKQPGLNVHDFADKYVKNEISQEMGMEEYFKGIQEVEKHNLRILKAVKTVKGKRFLKHLINFINNSGAVNWDEWKIVRTTEGNKIPEREYGHAIKCYWADSWPTGTEGDSFEGYFYVELKPSRYLKFHFSC